VSEPVPAAASLRYQPSLDGLRAVALLAVLLVHGMPAWLPGGFLGVDVFFVLSGYLITALLLGEAERTGRIALAGFWLRRARRLVPALVLVVAFVVLAGPGLLPEQDPAALRTDAVAALSYWANWRMILRGGDYFTQTAAASPLQHTWSLAIEEQFYLVWPLVIGLALRSPRRRLLIGAGSLACAAASTAWAATLHDPAAPDRVYFGTDTRAGALLTGCALAAAGPVVARHPAARRIAAVAGSALLGAAMLVPMGTGWLYHGGFGLVALGTTAVLAELTAAPRSSAARLLGCRPAVWLGRISYGGYLWHWPLFAVLDAERTGLTGPRLLAVRVGATLAAATVSFLAVERPIRRARGPLWRLPLGATATAAAATILALAGLPATAKEPKAVAAVPPAAPAAGPASPSAVAPPRPARHPGAPRVTVIGDSVSWTLGAYWPTDPRLQLSNEGVPGCGIAVLPELRYGGAPHTNYPYCATWEARWSGSVAKTDPDVVAILLDRWELMDRRLDGEWTHVGEPGYDAYLTGQLDRAVTLAAAHGARVALLTAPYTHRQERPDGGLWPEDTPERVDAWNRLLAVVAAAHPARPAVLDLNRVLCPDGRFTWQVGGVQVRSDGLHLTPAGVSRIVAPWLTPQLLSLAAGR
jgi:peptidoglycan/LPS O-acetylase OafA/YrhL